MNHHNHNQFIVCLQFILILTCLIDGTRETIIFRDLFTILLGLQNIFLFILLIFNRR